MPIVVGTNSWVTVAQADTYLADKYGAGAWAALDATTVKTPLLISAYRWLRRLSGYSLPAASLSQNLKDAQCEAAWYLYKHNDEAEKREALRAQGVKDFKVMSFSETLTASTLPAVIADLLSGFSSTYGHSRFTISRDLKTNSGENG